MTTEVNFSYKPIDHECEKASNSYLMSLVSMIVGLPLPIINLFATILFFILNRSETHFVRWHCTQALLSQLLLFFLNSSLFWWTVAILFADEKFSMKYLAYLILILIFNIIEITSTIIAAIKVRKAYHVKFFLIGGLTDFFCKK